MTKPKWSLEVTQFGALTTRVVKSIDESPQQDSEGKEGPVVVLLHGYGAPGDDLVGLVQGLEVPPGTRFVFPEGPLDLSLSMPGMAAGRAWWNIDVMRLQMALASGQTRDLSKEVPEGLEDVSHRLNESLDVIKHKLKPSHWVLGGFSQGAMLAVDTVLRKRHTFNGLICFSGTVISEEIWSDRIDAVHGLRSMVSHGRSDPILPFEASERLYQLLKRGGAQVEFFPFNGGHEIPSSALGAANSTLRACLKK